MSAHSLSALAYLIFIESIVGTFVWYKVMETFTAKGASMFLLFTPIFGLAIGSIALGEEMTVPNLLGGKRGVWFDSATVRLLLDEAPVSISCISWNE